jgi:hypothetical protein
MEIKHLKITTIRSFTTSRKDENGVTKKYIGKELIGRKPSGAKLKIETDLLFELPLLNEKEQHKALMENLSHLLIIEEKKQVLFYKNIKDGKKDPVKSRR